MAPAPLGSRRNRVGRARFLAPVASLFAASAPAGKLPPRKVALQGAAIYPGDHSKYWNSNVVKLFEASILSTKKYDPPLESLNRDTYFEGTYINF